MTERVEELLSAYLDGELTGAERAEVEALLAAPGPAREALAAMRRDGALLRGAAGLAEPDARGLARVRRAVLAAVPVPGPGWWERWLPAPGPVRLAALGLPLALALLAVLPGREPGPEPGMPVAGTIAVLELEAGAGDAFRELTVDEGAVTSRVLVPELGIDVLWVTQ